MRTPSTLALAGYSWDPLDNLNLEGDSDADSLPDGLLTIA